MNTIPESHHHIVVASQVVLLATNGPDGHPQVTATWFLAVNDGTVRLSINSNRQKAKNLQRDPRCTLFFIDPANPYRTIEIRGRAEIEDDSDRTLADAVGAKHGANLRDMDGPDDTRIAVTVVPSKINTYG